MPRQISAQALRLTISSPGKDLHIVQAGCVVDAWLPICPLRHRTSLKDSVQDTAVCHNDNDRTNIIQMILIHEQYDNKMNMIQCS